MIEFESVSKTYRDGTHAVADLSLVVPSGKITVFVGPSGCGKTTTLRMVNRMLEPSSGRIVWDGKPLKSKRRTTLRRQMGYVIQSGGLFPHRTVMENIGTVPGLLGWDKAKIRSRSKELLDAVGLDRKLGERYPAQLSGGQQQRVGVARALAADPLVMLMDEPFSAVDPVVRGELHEFFLDLQRELSKTIILITHDIDEAIKLGDQVAILRVGGRLAQSGTPQEVLERPADAFVEGFVGKDRGYRALSFMPATAVDLSSVKVVRDASTADGDDPVLVVDSEAGPQGWIDPASGERLLRMGSVFDPQTDTLRVALDSALTSPVGLAVAVDRASGRYIGVVGADQILAQVTRARAALDGPSTTGDSAVGAPAIEPEAPAESEAPPESEAAVESGVPPESDAPAEPETAAEPGTTAETEALPEPEAPAEPEAGEPRDGVPDQVERVPADALLEPEPPVGDDPADADRADEPATQPTEEPTFEPTQEPTEDVAPESGDGRPDEPSRT